MPTRALGVGVVTRFGAVTRIGGNPVSQASGR